MVLHASGRLGREAALENWVFCGTLPARRARFRRAAKCARRRILRRPDRQRFESRHDGGAVCHPPKGTRRGGGGRHRLDSRRHLRDRNAAYERRRHHAHEERNVGRESHQVLGVSRRACRCSTSRRMVISTTGYTSGFSVTGNWLHIKGLEIKNVPMNTRSNTGMWRERQQQHLRALESAPQQRHRPFPSRRRAAT